MAVALVFAFLTFEAIRQGVTNAVITGSGVTVVALAGAAACLARLAHREEIVSHRRLRSLATTDAQWRATQRKRVPLPVLFIDIDSFKRFNDTLGHEVGDEVLRTVAKGISAVVAGAGGFVARYGGDEFGVVLGNVSPARAERLAWAIRRGAEDMRIQTHGLGHGTLTVSAGCVICEPPCALRADELTEAADGQLNAAKAAGRNRVCSLTLNGGALAIAEDVSPGWPKSAAPAAM